MLIRRMIRFGLTGLLNTAVHVVIASSLIELMSVMPAIANGIAFTFATLISYFINTVWSFAGTLHGRTLFRFVAVSLMGLALASGVSGAISYLGLSYWYGIAAVVSVLPLFNFSMHHFWTYR
jgi:putative flippase GtrA